MVVGIVLTISVLPLLINLAVEVIHAADPRGGLTMRAPTMKRLWLPGGFVALIVLAALCAPLFRCPIPFGRMSPTGLAGPMRRGPWLGRDEFGRDVFSRLVWGARTSLSGLRLGAGRGTVGVLLGLIGGWGRAAFLSVRSMDVVLCPCPCCSHCWSTLLGRGAATLILVLSVLYLLGFARVTLAPKCSVKGRDYVEATRALGAPPWYLLLRTVLPNIAGPIQFSLLAVAAAVVLESGLSSSASALVPPAPSWGLMIRGAHDGAGAAAAGLGPVRR